MKFFGNWTFKGALLLALLGFGVACSVIESSQVGSVTPTANGVPYCLPFGKVRISVIANPSDSADAAAPGAGARPAQYNTNNNLPTSNQPGPTEPTHEKPDVALPPTLPAHQTDAAEAAPVDTQRPPPAGAPTPARDTTGKPARPAAATPAEAPRSTYEIKYQDTYYYPDPRLQYVAHYRPNALSDETVDITVRKDSLLSKVDISTEDKSGAVILKIAQLAQKITTALAAGDNGKEPHTIYDATFDPFDPAASEHVARDLLHVPGGPYSFEIIGRSPRDYKADVSPLPQPPRVFCGVAFRPVLAYDLVLKCRHKTTSIQTVLLPNEATVLSFPITRSPFIKKGVTLTFDGGILTEAKVTKPSEALAAMDIPLGIVDAILAVPSNAVANVTGSTAAKKGDLTNAANSLTAQQNYQQALNDSTTPTAPKSALPGRQR